MIVQEMKPSGLFEEQRRRVSGGKHSAHVHWRRLPNSKSTRDSQWNSETAVLREPEQVFAHQTQLPDVSARPSRKMV